MGWGGHRASVCSGFSLRGRKLFSFSFLSGGTKAPDRKLGPFGKGPAICSLEGPETKEIRESGSLELPEKSLLGPTVASYLRAATH